LGKQINLTALAGWIESTFFAKPSYQSALSYAKRAVPDVSSDANPSTGALIILNGASEQVGGTSLSSPMWAGLMGLVNSTRLTASKPTLGLLNGRIYPLLGTNNFRDITVGGNGGYSAGPGYDLVTGIGASGHE
jgi:kumamolisin